MPGLRQTARWMIGGWRIVEFDHDVPNRTSHDDKPLPLVVRAETLKWSAFRQQRKRRSDWSDEAESDCRTSPSFRRRSYSRRGRLVDDHVLHLFILSSPASCVTTSSAPLPYHPVPLSVPSRPSQFLSILSCPIVSRSIFSHGILWHE